MPNCPHCQSIQTQSLKMVVQSGINTGSSLGLGIGQNGPTVSGNAFVFQSGLAEKYNPGTKPNPNSVFIGCMVAAGALFLFTLPIENGYRLGLFFAGLSIATGFIMREVERGHLQIWKIKNKKIHNFWLCLQCGHEWAPNPSFKPDPAASGVAG